jgi:hypothetical protein
MPFTSLPYHIVHILSGSHTLTRRRSEVVDLGKCYVTILLSYNLVLSRALLLVGHGEPILLGTCEYSVTPNLISCYCINTNHRRNYVASQHQR